MSSTNAFNTQPQDATTGKQQQQPGYLDKAFNLFGSLSGSNDSTTDSRNQQPHVGGVGDMGTKSDVARPTEERANPNPFTSGGTSESLENPNITDPNSIQQRLNARNPPNPYPEGNAGVGLSSDKQFHNKQDHVGGVGDLGTRSDADVVRLPEERANPDPLASAPGATNPSKDTTTGAATGFGATRDHNRDTTDTANTTSTLAQASRLPEQKSWDTRNVAGTLHDPTQHGHSGGVTGSNMDTDHGLGMPHRDDTQRGNRDEGAIGQHQQKWAGATDFQSGRDGGFNADTRDQGVNERTQAPVDTTNRHPHLHRDDEPLNAENRDRGANDLTQAPFGGVDHSTTSSHRHHDRDNEALNGDTRDQGMNERTRDPLGGVDNTTSSTHPHRHHDRGDEAFNADTRDRGAHDRTQVPIGGVDNTTTSTHPHRHHDRDDEALNTDTRDRAAHDRTQAPIGGVDNTTTSTHPHRHHDRDNEALNANTRDRGAHDRTQAPVGGVDNTTTSAHRHPDRDVAMEERRDEDENASPTGKKGPGKLDKLHGKFMVAKGKLTKDPEAIAQGERLQTEGVTIRPSDILDERRE